MILRMLEKKKILVTYPIQDVGRMREIFFLCHDLKYIQDDTATKAQKIT